MYSHKSTILLLLLVSAAFSFDVTEYFYSNEQDVTVTYNDFTLDGTEYSMVSLNGHETFLLKDNVPLEDKSEIEEALYLHYLDIYYPSEEELNNLEDLLDQYNQSRNDGQKFVGKEEYTCRSVLFIDGRVKTGSIPIYCRDDDDVLLCNYSAMLMYQYLSAMTTPPVGSWMDLLDPIQDFGYSSYGLDRILGEIDTKLEAGESDKSKMHEALIYIDDSIPAIEDYHDEIENSKFGWTETKSCDSTHWCLCPDIDLNDSALDNLKDLSEELSDKIVPLSNYESVASKIYINSINRIDYATTEKLAANYTDAYEELNQVAETVIPMGNEASTRVLNSSLSQKVNKLETLQASIPNDIDIRDFNTTESDLEEFEELLDDVESASVTILTQYNKTKDAKNLVNSLILILETKDLDPVSTGSLNLLKNSTADLDTRFHDGISLNELAALEGDYKELAEDGQKLLKKENDMPATKVLLLFRGFARHVNGGIANVAEETDVIEPQEIPDNQLFTLGLFSTVLFLSLGSIVILVFLYVVATTKFVIPKTSHILASAFVSLIILLFGFSIFTYLFLSKTSTDATLTEFLADFDSKNSTAIVVDLQDTSYSDASAMNSCASYLADTMSQKNKTWTIYQISANTCTVTDESGKKTVLTTSACWDKVDNESSSFELGYSASNEPPKFSVIYENKAQIKANLDYYDSCPLASLFS